MRVTKVYDDGRLVSCKRTGRSNDTQVDSRCLTALRKEATYEMNAFILNVSALQKELARTKRLLGARTSERNSARRAHRRRLQQVYILKSKIEDLKLDSLILQEDIASLKVEPSAQVEAPTKSVVASDYTFGVRAKAIKKG